MDYLQFANEIKNRLNMSEILDKYGYEIKKNRIRCPFHDGNDFNCGVKQDYIHCFVCGESADQIKFIQSVFDLSFRESIEKLNDDFLLSLPIGQKLSKAKQIDIAKRNFIRKAERKRAESELNRLKSNFFDVLDKFIDCEKKLKKYAPKALCDELEPEFIYAITNIERLKYELNEADEELIQYEKGIS